MNFNKILAIFIALNVVLLTPAFAYEMPQNITHGSKVINNAQFDKNSGISKESQNYNKLSTPTLLKIKQKTIKYVTVVNPINKAQTHKTALKTSTTKTKSTKVTTKTKSNKTKSNSKTNSKSELNRCIE